MKTWFFGAFSLPHYRNYRCRRNYPAGTGSGTPMLTAPSGSMTAITFRNSAICVASFHGATIYCRSLLVYSSFDIERAM